MGFLDYDKIYTINELKNLLEINNKFTNTLVKELNCPNPKILKIFICNDFYEEDAYDNDHKLEISEDYILSHGKYQYYVAELVLRKTGEFQSISNIIWGILDDVFSISCHIVKYHKNYPNFKKYYILDYLIPDRDKRYDNNKYNGFSYDLYEILNSLENTTYDTIDKNVCNSIQDGLRNKLLDELNQDVNNFYDINRVR